MSRGLSTAFKSALLDAVIYPAMFVKMSFDSGDLNLWTGISAITTSVVSGTSEEWIGSGTLGTVSAITETESTQANGITLELSGVSSGVYETVIATKYRNRPIKIWFGLMNSAFTTVAYAYQLGGFRMDQLTITDEIDETGAGSIKLTMSAEGGLVDLFRANNAFYSDADQKSNYPGDTFFNKIATLPGIEVPWNSRLGAGGSAGGSGNSGVARPGWGGVWDRMSTGDGGNTEGDLYLKKP